MIKITLETGVIATPENHKRTVWALGLRKRESSKLVKDTPALRAMVKSVCHLVTLEKVDSSKAASDPFQAVPEYELGAVTERKVPEKKRKAPSLKTVEGDSEKKEVKASSKKSAKSSPKSEKSSSTKASAKEASKKTTKKAK
ncbi:MAG: 50S ribosomal protein L30 [bacterium]